jgi:hypothetical protein
MTGAKSATSVIRAITTMHAIATRSRLSLAQASCQEVRPSIASGPGSTGGAPNRSSSPTTWLTARPLV